jgi:hypothetical protein
MTALWIQARQLETVGWATSAGLLLGELFGIKVQVRRFLEDARYKHLPFGPFQDYGWLFPACLAFHESFVFVQVPCASLFRNSSILSLKFS